MSQALVEDDGAAKAVAALDDIDVEAQEDAPPTPPPAAVLDGDDQAIDEDPDPADDGTVGDGADDPANDDESDAEDITTQPGGSADVPVSHEAVQSNWFVRLLQALFGGAK